MRTRTGIILNVVISTEMFVIGLFSNEKTMTVLQVLLFSSVLALGLVCQAIHAKYDEFSNFRSIKYRCRQLFKVCRLWAGVLAPLVFLMAFLPNTAKDEMLQTEIITGSCEQVTVATDGDLSSTDILPSEGTGINRSGLQSDENTDETESPEKVNADDSQISGPAYTEEYSLENNIEFIKSIRTDEEWRSLSLPERQDTIKHVIESLLYTYGIPYKIDVIFYDFERSNERGKYLPMEEQIVINNMTLLVGSNEDNLSTAIHESRHVYQFYMICVYNIIPNQFKGLKCFEEGVAIWDENYKNYIDSDDDYAGYRQNPIEEDAFSYAEKATKEYLILIEEILSGAEEE